ncbi:MAG: hypothetical protein JOZ25_06110 [Actinobacteria bacterium]|nr:hypothetical protein [Actinomycetota bacterium]
MDRSSETPSGVSGRRGNIILGLAIAGVAIAAIVNVPSTIEANRWVKRDLAIWQTWVAQHGGRSVYGRPFPDEFGSVEAHDRFDVVCFPHYPRPPSKRADYKVYLLVDSHGSRPVRILRTVHGPLRPKPTASGPKCGKGPKPPPGVK